MVSLTWLIIKRLAKYAVYATPFVQTYRRTHYNVEPGNRAVEFSRFSGTKSKVYQEGFHFTFPYLEWPIIYDVRACPLTYESTSGSRDLQKVSISLRVLARPLEYKLPVIYQTLGQDYNERVMPSIVQETLQSVVAQYNASQLLTERDTVCGEIRDKLKARAAVYYLQVDDVSITNLRFGKEFTAAIEAKQVAAQQAEMAKYLVAKAQEDKKSAIIRAEGEAKSALLIGQAIGRNKSFITLRKIEASREITKMVSESKKRVMLNTDELLLNVQEM